MKNIIIVGAFVNNKGAQSMIFTVVDQIRKIHPNSSISLIINSEPSELLVDTYNFNFINIGIKDKLRLTGGIFSVISYLKRSAGNKETREKFENTIEKADLIIDISGFALSSKFTRNNTINYLSHISLAKKNNIPIVLFPQSFGPFNYNKIEKLFLMSLIRKYLKYPTKIFAREKEGYDYLDSLGLRNINLAVDTVFQKTDEYNLNNIFKKEPVIREVSIADNSVGIIPNVKTINSKNEKTVYYFYNEIIKELTKLGKNVYLIRHSTEDLDVINRIYQDYKNDENVYLIKDEYNSIELNQILRKFDYIVASRYHSIVHAYKAGTPALVMGWAVKYKELLQNFNQSQYQFDVKNIDVVEFISKLKIMNGNFIEERKIIFNKLDEINEKSIFDEILK